MRTASSTSSSEAKWLNTVRLDTPARTANSSAVNRAPSPASTRASAASRIARRCRTRTALRPSNTTSTYTKCIVALRATTEGGGDKWASELNQRHSCATAGPNGRFLNWATNWATAASPFPGSRTPSAFPTSAPWVNSIPRPAPREGLRESSPIGRLTCLRSPPSATLAQERSVPGPCGRASRTCAGSSRPGLSRGGEGSQVARRTPHGSARIGSACLDGPVILVGVDVAAVLGASLTVVLGLEPQ